MSKKLGDMTLNEIAGICRRATDEGGCEWCPINYASDYRACGEMDWHQLVDICPEILNAEVNL